MSFFPFFWPLYYYDYAFGIFMLFFISYTDKNTHHGRKSYSRLTKTIASQWQHLATYPLRVMTTIAYVLLTLLSVYFVLLDDFRNDNLYISLYTFFLFFGKIFCNYSV
jgi:hypothetical protein